MYHIVIFDYIEKKQLLLLSTPYLLEARDDCEEVAVSDILVQEGAKYLNGPLYRAKGSVKKGYYLVRKDKEFYTTITLYKKEVNGIIYSGDLVKVKKYITVKFDEEMDIPHRVYGRNVRFDEVVEEIQCMADEIQRKHVREVEASN